MQNRRQFIIATLSAGAAITLAGHPSLAGGHGRIGTFTGKSSHVTTGRAEFVVHGDKAEVVLLDDFTFDGAPDPKVALGKDGYNSSLLIGKLQKNSGKQTYEVPAGMDIDGVNEVWIWCEKFNVPLGVAKLN